MNELEKKSFYSFLGLYIVSSFLFLALIGYWYYTAQKNALENEAYYKLQHIADVKSGDIIMAHMQNMKLKEMTVPKDVDLALIDIHGKVIEGKLHIDDVDIRAGYFHVNGYDVFVSAAPREHLDVKYVLVQSRALEDALGVLQTTVISAIAIISFLVAMIAWVLSKLFMKPLRQKVEQVERFINDMTHELNTPITSLSMATNQALKHGECTHKTLNNISISTKQLYDIYSSLAYLSFSSKKEFVEPIDLEEVLTKSVTYYRPLADIKRISFEVSLESAIVSMPESQATLLFGNLIGNAIKYSSPKSSIRVILEDKIFTIKDEGIGIDPQKQKEIFEKFKRGTAYSGGFGVGLSIVKSICEEYGIQIELDSVPDVGTEFRLYF